MNNLNLNFDLFDLSPYTLFYGMCGVCMLLLLALWKLYQRNEGLESDLKKVQHFTHIPSTYGILQSANEALTTKLNSHVVEINYLQKEIKTERNERANLGFEIARLEGELKESRALYLRATLDIDEYKKELANTEDARLFLEKSNQALLTKYNAAQKEIKRLKARKKEAKVIEPAKPEYEFEEKIAEIKEGDKFLCTKDHHFGGFITNKEGVIYVGGISNAIGGVNYDGELSSWYWDIDQDDSNWNANKHFKKIKQ